MDIAENFRGIKISKDFFMSDRVDILLSQDHGSDYLIMLQQLILLAIENNYTLEYDMDKLKDSLKYYSSYGITQGLRHLELLRFITIEDRKIYFLASDGKTKLNYSRFFAVSAENYKGE